MTFPRRFLVIVALLIAAGCSSGPKKPPRPTPAPPRRPIYQPPATESIGLLPGSTVNSRVCDGIGWEWFRFELQEKSTVSVDLMMGGTGGDLDLYLHDHRVVLTPPAEEPLAFSRSSTLREEQVRKELDPGVYYVNVVCFGNARGESVSYDLTLSVTGVGPIDEPVRQAYPVREWSKGNIGIGYKYRTRWYAPTFETAGTLVLEFRPSMQRGELRIDVVTPDGQILGTTTSATALRTLRVPVKAGTHYFHLEPTTPDATGAFTFNFILQPVPPSPAPVVKRTPSPAPVVKRTPSPPVAVPATAPGSPPEPAAPVEAPRSAATRLAPQGTVRISLGNDKPVARWYSFRASRHSRVKIHCNCSGDTVTLDLYRRGSDDFVARGISSIEVEVDAGEYEVRVSTASRGPASGTIKSEIRERDDAPFGKQQRKNKKRQ